ncbi:MAG: Rad52/Rad22 family DNA repair protein [Phycisphaerae bacterium]|nr:Rad52/Rad22 family DNA repair protein [Phycisphaerae bacterium]
MANKSIDKAKEAKDTKNALMLNPNQSILNSKQLLHILQKTPKEHIYSRPAKGGGNWDYVTSTYVKKVLNYVFGWMWDFEIKEHGKEGRLVWVLGRLIIKDKEGNPMIVKEQFGRAEIKLKKDTDIELDFGNDLKAAASDALKKCASELGIASDVYGKNEFRQVGIKTVQDKKDEGVSKLMAGEQEIERIKSLAKEMGLDTVAKIEKKIGLSVDFKAMTKTQASRVYAELLSKQQAKK